MNEPARVIIIDDNQHAVEALAILLRHYGYEVLVAYDPHSAFELVENAPHIDAVLLDIGLPQMDGYETAKELRKKLAKKQETPPLFMAISGYSQEEDRRKSVEAGFDYHLVKPVGIAEIKHHLEVHLQKISPVVIAKVV